MQRMEPEALTAAAAEYARASAAMDRAREQLHEAIRSARAAGMKYDDIAEVSGLTRQMAHPDRQSGCVRWAWGRRHVTNGSCSSGGCRRPRRSYSAPRLRRVGPRA